MKLVKCDMCGKLIDPSEAGEIKYDGHDTADIIFKNSKDEYISRTLFVRDVCTRCAIKVLEIMYPQRAFMPIEEYTRTSDKRR